MRIEILASKMDLTPALRDYVEKKLDKVEPLLKRFPEDSFVVRVELGKTSDHHEKGKIFKAEAHIALPQRADVYAESVEEDLYAAIDLMTDGLKRQLLKDKDKHLTARKTKEE